jgi:uncharacterized delta-60 repeat protein
MIPLLARGLAPTAAVASGLMTPVTTDASGELDTTFGDVGRMVDLGVAGPAWSLEALEDDGVLFAGGWSCDGWYCGYYYDYADNFIGQLSGTGSIDLSYEAAELGNVEIFDVALQKDGKAVAVGRTVANSRDLSRMTIVRLERNGALDLTFGEDGIVRSPVQGFGDTAGAVTIDSERRIVVAGSEAGRLVVRRLLENGAIDQAFGSAGTFTGPDNRFVQRMHIVRTGGGYRITANSLDTCRVVALTENGAPEAAFGNAGVKVVGGPPGTTHCKSMAAHADGRLLLAGSTSTGAFVTRLLASGEPDPSFVPTVIPELMRDATALAIGAGDSVLIAGQGPVGVSGALIVRLQASGELDLLFGNAGATWIDLPFDGNSWPEVHDVAVLPGGGTVAAGGFGFSQPFVVKLVGPTGAGGPGVVGVKQADLSVGENFQQATVTVRRMGGATGRISVAYQTVAPDWEPATGGADYAEVSGRLTWENGDVTEREIAIPIVQDTLSESSEFFVLALEDVQGGAGLGTRIATVEIADDEPPVVTQPPDPDPERAARRGGGALGILSVMLLGLARLLRPRSYSARAP